jgi:hypothetical protein
MRTKQSHNLWNQCRAMVFAAPSICIAVIALSSCCGCGNKDEFEIAPVSGAITLNGRPLVDARIGFEPMAINGSLAGGSGSYGTTDSQGTFQLATVTGRRGAIVGRHRVWIRTIKLNANGKVISQETLPREYNDDTTLSFDVSAGGTDQANFAIAAKPSL